MEALSAKGSPGGGNLLEA